MRILPLLITISFLGSYIISYSQDPTVGLLSYKPWQSYDGYNIIYPHNQPNVYLLNNCGEVVHVWEDSTHFRPGNTAYLLENGNLLKTKRSAVVAGNPIWAGGGGGTLEIRSWDNDLLWSYTLNDAVQRMHHDIAPMPNGNLLAIVWELKTLSEAIEAGRDTNLLSEDKLWPDKIVEIDPLTNQIVWEWKAWDHLVQEFDESKANYGLISEHPGLINLNYDTNDGKADWFHSNALDYDEINDLVVISVPTFDEIWVIDHSTTTAQAAGHTGGFSGKGGDLIYRWGNPEAYGRGTAEDKKLFYQHDIHWNNDFLSEVDPNFGKFAVFNNRVGSGFSQANIFDHGFDMYEFSFPMIGDVFGPEDFDLTLMHPTPQKMYSTGLSSVQFLPNGNVLLCSGRFGYSFEMTPEDEIVWEYKTPLISGNPATQGDVTGENDNLTFRMFRYPADYSAFLGKELDPLGYIELQALEGFCEQILPVMEQNHRYGLRLFPNPADQMISIHWNGGIYADIEVFNSIGRQMYKEDQITGGMHYLNISGWERGMYIVRINQTETKKFIIE